MGTDFSRSEMAVEAESEAQTEAAATGDGPLLGADSEVRPVVSVVIPTLNEEEGIGACIDAVIDGLEGLGLTGEVVVSDSSTDRTPEIARDRGAIVVEPDAPGYGYAYRYAFERARGDFVVIGDADTTYDFSAIPALFDRLEETDAHVVLGSRLAGEIRPGAMPPLHQFVGNPLLTRFLNVFYDAGVTDAHSGFRLLRREVLDELRLESDGMEFASEMIMEAASRGLTIEEVPITYYEREGEATLDSFQDGWRHVKFMLVNAPNYLFSLPGGVWCLVGMVLMALSYPSPDVWGFPLGLPTMVAGSMLTILGSQVWTLGVFATAATDPIQSPKDRLTLLITERVSLEHGTVLGGVFTALGVGIAGLVGLEWAFLDYTEPAVLKGYIVAFTMIVLGLLTVFQSFFLMLIRGGGGRR